MTIRVRQVMVNVTETDSGLKEMNDKDIGLKEMNDNSKEWS